MKEVKNESNEDKKNVINEEEKNDLNKDNKKEENIVESNQLNKKESQESNIKDLTVYVSEKWFSTLTSFLSHKDKISFYFTSKKFNNLLIQLFTSIQTNLSKINEKKSPDEKISELKSKYSENDLAYMPTEFIISKTTQKGIEMLNKEDTLKFFEKDKIEDKEKEIVLIWKIFFYLIEKENIYSIENDEIFWKKMSKYIIQNCNKKVGTFILDKIKEFKFNEKIIFYIESYILDKKDKIVPTYFTKICKYTGLVTFIIKEALEYCEILYNEKRSKPFNLLKKLEYEKKLKEVLENYLNFLNKCN